MKRALVLLAACGGDPANPDAPPVQPGGTSVEVRLGGLAQPNVEVMFQDADGTVRSVTATGIDGIATGEVDVGGFVTIVEPRLGVARDTLTTFTGVQPDDTLHLDLSPPSETETVTFGLQITLDTDPLVVEHAVYTSCGQATSFGVTRPEPVTLIGCGPEIDVLVVSAGESGPLRAQLTRDVRTNQDVQLTGPYVDFLTPTIQYANLPSGVTFVGAFRAYETERGRLFETSVGVTGSGTATATVLAPDESDTILTASAVFPPAGAAGEQVITEWTRATANRDYVLDVAGTMVAPFASRPSFDLATRTASWSESAGAAPNYVRAALQAYRDDIPEGRAWTWRIAAAHAGTEIAFPKLPPARDGFDFNVLEGDSVSVNALTTAKLPAGYAETATRSNAFADLKKQVTGATGRLIVQELTEPAPPPQPEL